VHVCDIKKEKEKKGQQLRFTQAQLSCQKSQHPESLESGQFYCFLIPIAFGQILSVSETPVL